MATALHKGSVFITDFEADALSDPAIHSLAERVKLIRDEQNTDENAVGPAYVRIRLTDGMEHALTIPHALGSPDNPLPSSPSEKHGWRVFGGMMGPVQ